MTKGRTSVPDSSRTCGVLDGGSEDPETVNSSIRYALTAWPLVTNRTPPVVNPTKSLRTTVHKA